VRPTWRRRIRDSTFTSSVVVFPFLSEFLLSIDNPATNTLFFVVEELSNADCAVEDVAFEIDIAEDRGPI